ncbi:hypothetical protein COCNU_contig69474200G000010 [Cocos nucifera]|nr:hypothetical protein [Cocos nucifera]
MPVAWRAPAAAVAPAPTKRVAMAKALKGIMVPLFPHPRRYDVIPAPSWAELAVTHHHHLSPPPPSPSILPPPPRHPLDRSRDGPFRGYEIRLLGSSLEGE